MPARAVAILALLCAACGSPTAKTADAKAGQPSDATFMAADPSPAAIDPCAADAALADPPTPALYTPRWAFEPWISKDISTAADTRDFVNGFVDRGIPVGVVVLDSPWETQYQTFVPSPSRYPGFKELVGELHGKNVRVVVWLTAMVNEASYDLEPGGDKYDGPAPNLAEGLKCGHFVNQGATSNWWKGWGAAVDFFSPAARTWWNRQQLELLTTVDGYKLDFGEMYIDPAPMQTAAGVQTLDAYSRKYYRDMLAFGRSRNPEFLTMVRPWDKSYQFDGRFFAKPEHAPVAWVGDNRRDWVGLSDALDSMFRSALAGYTVLGSDIGGYLDRDDQDLLQKVPWDAQVFARWLAVGALGPFMQLHGRANLTPWTLPDHGDELQAAYKYWARWHHQLAPMLYSVVRRSQTEAKQPLVLQPVQADEKTWAGDFRYLLGGGLWMVAPLVDGTGKRDVPLPAGHAWLDWWHLAAAPLPGGTTATADMAGDYLRTPLYLRACSVQPFSDGDELTHLAPAGVAGHDGWLVAAAEDGQATFSRLGDGAATASVQVQGGKVTVVLSERARQTVVAVRTAGAPKSVLVDGAPLAESKVAAGGLNGWMVDANLGLLWVGLAAGGKVELVVQ